MHVLCEDVHSTVTVYSIHAMVVLYIVNLQNLSMYSSCHSAHAPLWQHGVGPSVFVHSKMLSFVVIVIIYEVQWYVVAQISADLMPKVKGEHRIL